MKQISIDNLINPFFEPFDDRGGSYPPSRTQRPGGRPPQARGGYPPHRPGPAPDGPMRPSAKKPGPPPSMRPGDPRRMPPRSPQGMPPRGMRPNNGTMGSRPAGPGPNRPPQRPPYRPPAPPVHRSAFDDDFDSTFEDEELIKKKKKNKLIIIGLDVLILGLLITAAVLIIYPKYVNAKQKKIRDDILDSINKQKGKKKGIHIQVPKNKFQVPGERMEQGFSDDSSEFNNDQDDNGGEAGNVNIHIIGKIVIAKIGCNCPIAADASKYSLRFAMGKWPLSPGFAENGCSMVFGHRFLDKGRDFNRLDEVKENDSFYIDSLLDAKRLHYKVYKVDIINADKLSSVINGNLENIEDNEVMLITCHPLNYGSSKQRLLVYGKLSKSEDLPNEGE